MFHYVNAQTHPKHHGSQVLAPTWNESFGCKTKKAKIPLNSVSIFSL